MRSNSLAAEAHIDRVERKCRDKAVEFFYSNNWPDKKTPFFVAAKTEIPEEFFYNETVAEAGPGIGRTMSSRAAAGINQKFTFISRALFIIKVLFIRKKGGIYEGLPIV